MYKIIKNSWALFTGFGMIIISHGFQGNLLGIRSVLEDFNYIATGTMMSGYFIGYFIGANMVPNLSEQSWSYKSVCSICIYGFLKFLSSCSIC